jgi:trehalose 6-phosphate phosphatase
MLMNWRKSVDPTFFKVILEPQLGLITDVDGTLSPIVEDPDKAQVTSQNKKLLNELQQSLPLVAVVSGRAAPDVHDKVGVPGVVYVGNHGLERCVNGDVVVQPEVTQYRPDLKAAMEELEPHMDTGIHLEDKKVTLSVHYRRAVNPQEAETMLSQIVERVADDHNLRFFKGRMVFELRPPIDADKGSAFHHLVSEYNLKAALYLGDDTTDVAALRRARQLRERGECDAWGIGVESPGMPQELGDYADFLIAGVPAVESFLDWLLRSRKASSA